MIEVCDVTKKFDSFKALDNLSLNVEKGSIYGLVGPNGAGKTTLMKIIMGVYKADNGKILINDEDVYENVNIKDIKMPIAFPTTDLISDREMIFTNSENMQGEEYIHDIEI